MKFHPGMLAAVAAVSSAALAGCDGRPQQACGTLRPDGRRVDCTHHGFGFWPIFIRSYGGGARSFGPSSSSVSRGGFGATAAGHGGGGAGE